MQAVCEAAAHATQPDCYQGASLVTRIRMRCAVLLQGLRMQAGRQAADVGALTAVQGR